MVARLTVIFFIILCLLSGIVLIVFPWFPVGNVGEWSQNYFLIKITTLLGAPFLQTLVSSLWFRGAVTGLGVFNLLLAFWEMANFGDSVRSVEQNAPAAPVK